MPHIIVPRRRVVQPQADAGVDWRNSLSRGITSYRIPAGLGLNALPRQGSTAGSFAKFGVTVSVVDPDTRANSLDGTVLVLHQSTTLPPNGGPYCAVLYSNIMAGTNNGLMLMLGNGNGYQQFRLHNNSSALKAADGTVALNDGKPHVSVATYGSANGVAALGYTDGALVATSGTAGTWNGSTTAPRLGLSNDSFWGGFDGSIGLVVTWNRILSAQEVAIVSANPWQLFAPTSYPVFFNNPLWDKIDETSPNDSDYIWTPSRGSEAEVKLGTITTPLPASGNTVRVRAVGNPAPMIARVPRTRQPLTDGRVNSALPFAGRVLYLSQLGVDGGKNRASYYQPITLINAPVVANAALSAQPSLTQYVGFDPVFSGGKFLPSGPFTVLAFGVLLGGGGQQDYIIGTDYNFGGNNREAFTFRANTWSLEATTYQSGVTGGASVSCSADYGKLALMYCVVGSDSATETWEVGYFVNKKKISASSSVAANSRASENWKIGAAADLSSGGGGVVWRPYTKPLAYVCIVDGRLSSADIDSIGAAPWSLFAPETRITFPRPILTTKLVQGTTVKATWTDPLTQAEQTFPHALTSGEASSITDGADLRLRFRVD